LGRIVPGITHEDYFNLSIVNTILGGYFGSRLMRNIREDKGYTYGIGSQIVSYQDASYLLVSTQVKAEYTAETIIEINNEFERLQNANVPEEELELVKNYLMGNLLQNLDGPFAQAKFITTAIRFGLDAQHLAEKISSSIRQISTKIIKDTAQIYLKTEPLNYSVSGNTKEIFK
jgi:zinc protease